MYNLLFNPHPSSGVLHHTYRMIDSSHKVVMRQSVITKGIYQIVSIDDKNMEETLKDQYFYKEDNTYKNTNDDKHIGEFLKSLNMTEKYRIIEQ